MKYDFRRLKGWEEARINRLLKPSGLFLTGGSIASGTFYLTLNTEQTGQSVDSNLPQLLKAECGKFIDFERMVLNGNVY